MNAEAPRGPETRGRDRLYIARGDDPEVIFSEIADGLVGILEEEQTGYEVVRLDGQIDHIPQHDMPELAPGEVYLFADVEAYSEGDAVAGGGRLSLVVELHRGGRESEIFEAQGGGGLGNYGAGAMKKNFRTVAKVIARRLLGRKRLNTDNYDWARESLRWGAFALIPVGGLFCLPIGVCYGVGSLVANIARGLPKGKLQAILGILLSLVAPFVIFVLIALAVAGLG